MRCCQRTTLRFYSTLGDELSTSQKQAIIKLIEKKDRAKGFIKNWWPISLLNVDIKLKVH